MQFGLEVYSLKFGLLTRMLLKEVVRKNVQQPIDTSRVKQHDIKNNRIVEH